jgi:hypothetical protein
MMRGMIIRGCWMPINGVIDRYVCRKCGARFGKPYADPVTGELDHNRIVCANEHEITQEGDIIPAAWIEERAIKSQYDKLEVMHNYGIEAVELAPLYENFEGFE